MNKKVMENNIDEKEDITINSVAHSKGSSQFLLFGILIVLFGVTLFTMLTFIGKYYKDKNNLDMGLESIQINNNKNSIYILNDSNIEKTVSYEDINGEDILITNVSSIGLNVNSSANESSTIKFDVKYEILENNFVGNTYSMDDSNLKVRFAYSYDNENWTYLNNAISTYEGVLMPLANNYYDIAGVVSTLKATTNYELSSKPGENTVIYWKCETLIKGTSKNVDNKIKANFKIEYKESL